MAKLLILLIFGLTVVSARFDISCENDSQLYPDWVTPSPCYQHLFRDIYIFGDSYSDNGQPLKNWKYYQTHTFPDRHSNGPMCVEYFTKMLGANLFNFAYSGATVDNSILYRNTLDIHQQIQSFQQKGGPVKLSDATLYAFWIGTNDVSDTFKLQSNPALREKTIIRTLSSLYNALETLYHMPSSSPYYAVKHLLVMGLLPVEHMPVITSLISKESQRAPMTELVAKYNQGLEEIVQQFRQSHPDVQITFYNPQRLINRLFSPSSPFDVSTPCFVQNKICPDENRRVWWDDYHPTTVTSFMVAKDMYQSLFDA